MREHHTHYCGWMIFWDDPANGKYRFWISELIYLPDDGSTNVSLHHMGMYPSIADGKAECEDLISGIITDQAALTYQRVSEYHHSRNPPTVFDQDDSDEIPF
jgi:hypothetical protein